MYVKNAMSLRFISMPFRELHRKKMKREKETEKEGKKERKT